MGGQRRVARALRVLSTDGVAARQPAQPHDDEPAFVLHAYPYRETSLIVEAFTAGFGRVAMVARGAKRPRSEVRGLLQAFQPLTLSWAGSGELKTLTKAEWRGGLPLPRGAALLCGFYLNELLLKLLAREDAHAELFDDYAAALQALATEAPARGAGGGAATLRSAAARGAGLRAAAHARRRRTRRSIRRAMYHYVPDRGRASSWRTSLASPGCIRGSCAARRSSRSRPGRSPDAETAADAKRLMRDVLDHHLEERRIVSRRVVRDLIALDRGFLAIMIELGVNIDHVATLRQARRTHEPDPVWAAVEAHLGGADGITVHLREDRRHIQDEDVRRLRELVHIKLNLELRGDDRDDRHRVPASSPRWRCSCPEGRHEITTEGGLDVAGQEAALRGIVQRLADAGHRDVGVHRRRRAPGRGGGAHRRARLRSAHRARTRTRSMRRDATPRAPAVVAELDRIRAAGDAIRALGMRFNAGHALDVLQRAAGRGDARACASCTSATPSCRAPCSPDLRDAVRQMKALMREAAASK